MGKAYFSKEDAIRRLCRTVCMYDGHPVYVDASSVNGEHDVHIYPLEDYAKIAWGHTVLNIAPKKVKYTDDKFSYKQVPLGYGYSPNEGCYYFTRVPDRKQKQGLSSEVLYADGRCTSHTNHSLLTSLSMYNCIKGIYPSRQEALALVKGGQPRVPFSRRLAFRAFGSRGAVALLFRTREIGLVDRAGNIQLLESKDRPFMEKMLASEGVSL